MACNSNENNESIDGVVLTYNVTNERGWNDPPSSVFIPSNSGRKRIDPRRRVAHDINNLGYGNPNQMSNRRPNVLPGESNKMQPFHSPLILERNNSYHSSLPIGVNSLIQTSQPLPPGQMNNLVHRYQLSRPEVLDNKISPSHTSLPVATNTLNQSYQQVPPKKLDDPGKSPYPHSSFIGQKIQTSFQNLNLDKDNMGVVHHAISNPDLHHQNICNKPTHPMHDPSSTPPSLNHAYSANDISSATGNTFNDSTFNNLYNDIEPFFVHNMKSNTVKSGTLTPPTNQSFEKQEILGLPMGSIFHKMGTPSMLNVAHLQNFNINATPSPSSQTEDVSINSLANSNRIPNFESKTSSLPQAQSLDTAKIYNRNSSTPNNIPQRISSINTCIGPPPMSSFYSQIKGFSDNSPRSLSPRNSGTNSPVAIFNENGKSDLDLLNTTIILLNNCNNKCACILTSKVSDDISKRIKTFDISWKSNKLSEPVKWRMSQLAEALSKSEFTLADNIHRILACDYSNEVMPWIVGIKKLITTYQQAVLENNKF